MIKSLALVILIIVGIAGSVFAVQNSTIWKSFGYDVIDFVSSFHSEIGDSEFNENLDINKDGVINVLDVLKDRYDQVATASSEETEVVDVDRLLNLSSSAEASVSAN